MAKHDLHVRIEDETFSAIAAYASAERRSVASAVNVLLARAVGLDGVDSEVWACEGCGGQFIGRRPEGGRCVECAS